jgi:putative hydrolase of the HAD superfamily
MNRGKFVECEAILFDFGGTLDSDGEHWLDRFYALYDEFGPDVPPSEIKRVFYHADAVCCADSQVNSLGLRPLMERHLHLQFEALNLKDGEKKRALVEAFCSKSEGYLQRNACLLQRLKRHYRLGLISNFYGNVAALCEEAGLAKSLEVIVDSIQVGMSKPEPDIFQSALNELNLLPEQVIFVGDSFERDIIPARELGMKTIWLKGPNPRVPDNGGPVDACISSLIQLDELIS